MFSYLPGNEEECQNSLRIINRTKKAPVNGTKINKNYNVETIEEIDDEDDEKVDDDDDDEDRVSVMESEANKENECESFDEPDDIEESHDETSCSRSEPLAVVKSNAIPVEEKSELFNQ